MPGYDGTGPKKEGPMTGNGSGYCVLKNDPEDPSHIKGFAGIDLKPVNMLIKNKKEVINMPGGDRTGPYGMGPRSGRGAGFCMGYSVPGYMNPGFGGAGFGRGYGRGRGWGRGNGMPNYAPQPFFSQPQVNPESEAAFLKDHISNLEKEIQDSKERIKELEKK